VSDDNGSSIRIAGSREYPPQHEVRLFSPWWQATEWLTVDSVSSVADAMNLMDASWFCLPPACLMIDKNAFATTEVPPYVTNTQVCVDGLVDSSSLRNFGREGRRCYEDGHSSSLYVTPKDDRTLKRQGSICSRSQSPLST
jgi:hypothetical protein